MTTAAVTAAEFGRLLLPLLNGDRPASVAPKKIAVAVSGGADSMTLALLAADWAKKRKTTILPLIVDHRLRPESTAEAKRVAGWLRQAGLKPVILTWKAKAKPTANRQAAARAARYDLLLQACAANNIRHLLVAHHRDDQAETLLLRALRGSGVDGLAAMQPRRQHGDVVLLRPLLDLPKARLVATLEKRRQPWVEDPSNSNTAYQRVRLRAALDLLSDHDPAARAELVTHLAQTARNFARTRGLLEDSAYDLLAASVEVTSAGIAWLAPERLSAAHDELALRGLSRLLSAIGGLAVPPRLDGLERLLDVLRAGLDQPQTLHRCLLVPQKDGRILVCREARHLPPGQLLRPGASLWDGRFRVAVAKALRPVVTLAPLGRHRPPETGAAAPPKVAWPALPALYDGKGRLLAVPVLGWGRLPAGLSLAFQPLLPPAGPVDED